MTPEELITALTSILPDSWEVHENKASQFTEVVAYHPLVGSRFNPKEPSISVSKCGNGWRTKDPWHAELSHWDEVHEYEEATWATTPEEALRYVEECLPDLVAKVEKWVALQSLKDS